MANYNIPIGIDAKEVLKGLDEIDAGLERLTVDATSAGKALGDVLNASAKSSETLTAKINAGAEAAKNLKTVATTLGADIEKAFSPDRVNTGVLSDKVKTFVANMKDVIGKPVDFKFNLPEAAINLLVSKLKDVGKQGEAMNLILESARQRLNELVKGSQPFNELSKQIKEAEKFLNVLSEDVVNINKEISNTSEDSKIKKTGDEASDADPKVQSLTKRARELTNQLSLLALAGKEGTAEFIAIQNEAASLASQIGDTNERVKALASDTAALDAGISAVKGLAGAFAAGQGVLAAFGLQSEDAAAAIQKVQGAMAILQGLQEVANVLNKDSALSVFLQSKAEQERAASVAASTTAIAAETATTETAVVATNAWTAALLANPIGLIVAAIAAATVAIIYFSQKEDEATLSAEGLNAVLNSQNKVLDDNVKAINRRLQVDEALAESQRKSNSEIEKIRLDALRKEFQANTNAIELLKEYVEQSKGKTKEDIAAREAANAKIADLIERNNDINAQGQALAIKQQSDYNNETNKRNLELLKQRFENAEAVRAILQRAADYAKETQAAEIEQLRDSQEKEIALIQQGLEQKIQAIDREREERLRNLREKRREANFDLETDRAVLQERIKGLDEQILLTEKGAEAETLKTALISNAKADTNKVVEKYDNERKLLELELQEALLKIQKDSEDARYQQLNIDAKREIIAISQRNIDKETKEKLTQAVLDRLKKDEATNRLESQQAEIELEKQKNINLINESEAYSGRSAKVQALKNIMLLKNEEDTANEQLKLLIDSGKELTSKEVVIAQARVDVAAQAVKDAIAKQPPQSVLSLLLPGSSPEELQFIEQQIQSTVNEVSKAIDTYSQIVQDRYQKIIDIKQKAIEQDEKELSDLEKRLEKEQQLRDDGLANNVNGILEEMAAKRAQREADIKEQEEYQKRLEASQKQQAQAQTALQAANIITAATNIYLKSSELGPIGVAAGSIAIAAMIAGFVLSKSAAAQAAQQPSVYEKGGFIKGRSHAEGGQRYYAPDATGGVMELEEGEYVVSRKQAEKYGKVLEAINNNTIKFVPLEESKVVVNGGLSDAYMRDLLKGTGVHVTGEQVLSEGVSEVRENRALQVNSIVNVDSGVPQLDSIKDSMSRLVSLNENKEEVRIENGWRIVKKGSKTIKTRI